MDREFGFTAQQWLRTHQNGVDGLLGPGVRRVRSEGNRFYNVDTWTGRAALGAICEFARLNPAAPLDDKALRAVLAKANGIKVSNPHIVINATPATLTREDAWAQQGGVDHECFHTLWSRRTPLTLEELRPAQALWSRLPAGISGGWSQLTHVLLSAQNIIDDIRIERRGCETYSAVRMHLEELQDLILRQEGSDKTDKLGHRSLPKGKLSVVFGVFRDLGLGYQTLLQRQVLEAYATQHPDLYAFVDSGPLRPLLDRAINMTKEDSLGPTWLAMEMIIEIATLALSDPQPQPGDGEGDGEGDGKGEGEGKGKGKGKPKRGPRIYSVGDEATVKATGQRVRVTFAGLPNDEGEQALEWEPV